MLDGLGKERHDVAPAGLTGGIGFFELLAGRVNGPFDNDRDHELRPHRGGWREEIPFEGD